MNGSVLGFSAAAAALGWFFWGTSASAATGGRLAYRAPDGCATESEFEASVAERGGHFDSAAAPDGGRELRVSIARAADGFRGSFQTADAGGASTAREVHGGTCPEVVAALAVVSAIALRGEDDSSGDDSKSDSVKSGTPPAASAVSASPSPSPSLSPPPEAEPEADEGHLHASSGLGGSQRIEVSAGTLRFDQARSITFFAGGELGILPSKVLPRYDLSFSGANFVTTPDGKSYISGVIPRLRVSYIGEGSYRNQGASVTARGLGFGLGLCWSPSYDTRAFVLLFCAEYGLGVMQLKSQDGVGAQSNSPAFQTAGLGFEGEYHLGSFLHLALKLGVDAPLQTLSAEQRDAGLVTSGANREIFHSSAFLGYGMLGLGFHF